MFDILNFGTVVLCLTDLSLDSMNLKLHIQTDVLVSNRIGGDQERDHH